MMHPLDMSTSFSTAMKKNGYTKKPAFQSLSEVDVVFTHSGPGFELAVRCSSDGVSFEGHYIPEGNNISSNLMDPVLAADILCCWINLCKE
jgi:hypothetical protein